MRFSITLACGVGSALLLLTAPGCPTEVDPGPDAGPVSDAGPDAGVDAGSDAGMGCTAGDQRACACGSDPDGQQACLSDGRWESCVCGGGCPAGEHDGGDGSCVPEGLCIFGHHDGGDGACALEGACSAGYRIGAAGICGLPEPCEAGVVVQPEALDFGPWPLGRERVLSLSLTNPSLFDACPLTQVALAPGSDPVFDLPGSSSLPATLTPGESATVEVRYRPTAAGTNNAILGITLGDAASTFRVVRIVGEGFEYALSLSPTAPDFGQVAVSCTSEAIEVCLQNDASAPLTLSNAWITGDPGFSIVVAPPTPYPIPGGGEVCFLVRWTPAAAGAANAALELTFFPGDIPESIPLTGEGVAWAPVTETLVQGSGPKADILWVMTGTPWFLAYEPLIVVLGDQLVTALEAQGVDYQIGVVSTDPVTAPTPGLLEPADRLGPHIVDGSMTGPGALVMNNLVDSVAGQGGLGDGLEVAHRALSAPLHTDMFLNGGFLRPDATLSLIFVSPLGESSDSAFDYLGFFRGLHGVARPDLLEVNAIVGPPPFGCFTPEGPVDAGLRTGELVSQTGGTLADLCAPPTWDLAMQEIAAGFALVSRFPLGQAAAPSGTIAVVIIATDGTRRPASGWSHDAQANAIDFDAANVPLPGEQIEVTYNSACAWP